MQKLSEILNDRPWIRLSVEDISIMQNALTEYEIKMNSLLVENSAYTDRNEVKRTMKRISRINNSINRSLES